MKPMTAEWVVKAEADCAVAFRYLGESDDKQSAVEAKNRLCIFFRKIARSALRLRT
jgi:hypothetical protein